MGLNHTLHELVHGYEVCQSRDRDVPELAVDQSVVPAVLLGQATHMVNSPSSALFCPFLDVIRLKVSLVWVDDPDVEPRPKLLDVLAHVSLGVDETDDGQGFGS